MHPEVHKYLDGEIPRAAMSGQAQAELREWETLDSAIAERRGEQAPPWLANDVMRALPAVTVPAWRRAWQWLVTPRPVHVPPFAPIAATALAVLAFVTLMNRTPATPAFVQTAQGEVPVVYVQFALTAQGAQTVSVAGD